MFVDSALRLKRPYGAREKRTHAILAVGKRFVAEMGVPRIFRTDNGAEYLNGMSVDYCKSLGIRYDSIVSHTSQQNGTVESAISSTF